MTDTHIKINAVTPRVQYTGNGSTTTFPYTFAIFDEDNLEVYLDDTLQESGYTVTGVGEDNGGNVVFSTAPTSGVVVTIYRNVPIERVTDFQEGGAFRPKNLNDEFDRQTAFCQQIQEGIGRCLQLSVTTQIDPSVIVPQVERIYDSIDNIDAVADNETNINTVAGDKANIDTVAGNTSNINTVAGISGNITTVAGISSNVTAVAGNATNINAVAGNETNINAVNANKTNIDTVAGNSTNINSVAGDLTNIDAVNANKTNIDIVATNISTIAEKVNKTGDTMSGNLSVSRASPQIKLSNTSITKGTNPSSTQYYGYCFNDASDSSSWKDTRIGIVEGVVNTDGSTEIRVSASKFVSGDSNQATLSVKMTKEGVESCTLPNTTCVDGQWVLSYKEVAKEISGSSSYSNDFDLSSYLPNDGQKYEVLLHASGRTGTTSGNSLRIYIGSSETSPLLVAGQHTRTSNYMFGGGAAIIPVGTNRKITMNFQYQQGTNSEVGIYAQAYRRVGTNS